MKSRLFIVFILILGFPLPTINSVQAQPVVHVNNRDTVRYGDPWYTFKPMPTLSQVRTSAMLVQPRVQVYKQTYTAVQSTLYGIAVTMDDLPPCSDSAWLNCWRGVYYHPGGKTQYFSHDKICFDSVLYSDSISMCNPPLVKQCVFEYQVGVPVSDGVYKTTTPVNCFEFYFDEPLRLFSQDTLFPQDTFLIGGYSNTLDPFHFHQVQRNFYYGVDSETGSQSWMEILHMPPSGYCHSGDTTAFFSDYDAYLETLFPGMVLCGNDGFCRVWGMIFPITELRCTQPRGLSVDLTAGQVRWDQDADGVQFQLSLCADGMQPESGHIVSTVDTEFPIAALPTLSPDTVYRLYLRKQCDFSTSHTTMVWSDWSQPVVATWNTEGGDEGVSGIESSGVRVYAGEGRIVVEGAEGMEVKVYDAKGCLVDNRNLPTGVYMVKVGDQPTRRVVVR